MDLQGPAMRSHTQKHQVRIQKGRDLAPGPFYYKKSDAPICWVQDGGGRGLQERRHCGFAKRIDERGADQMSTQALYPGGDRGGRSPPTFNPRKADGSARCQ